MLLEATCTVDVLLVYLSCFALSLSLLLLTYRCKQLVQEYVQDPNREARLMVGSDMRKIQLCFSLLKVQILCCTR